VFYRLLYYVQILVSLTYTLLLGDHFQVILGDSRSISNNPAHDAFSFIFNKLTLVKGMYMVAKIAFAPLP
jgi:hypothetical protein